METAPKIPQLLQEQYDAMEHFANAQARLLNASSTSSQTVESNDMDDALDLLYDVRNQVRSNLTRLDQDENFRKLYPKHLALSQRVVQTIAANPSWHTNGLPSHTIGITETNTVALATLRASIERINEAERQRTAI